LAETKNGKFVPTTNECLNTISADGQQFVFDDLKLRDSGDESKYYRGYDLIFAKEPKGGAYLFRGVFIRDDENSKLNHYVSKRIGTKVKLIGCPADRIEIIK
jgi:hypothetical protein